MSASTLEKTKSADYSSFIGEVIRNDHDIFEMAEETVNSCSKDTSKIVAVFLDRNRHIAAVHEMEATHPAQLDAGIIAIQAIKLETPEIALLHKVPALTKKEREVGIHQSTPMASEKALHDETQVKAYAELSVALKRKNITLANIFLFDHPNSYQTYTGSVSRALFPGISTKLSKVYLGEHVINETADLKDTFLGIKQSSEETPIYMLFLDEKSQIINAYNAQSDNNLLMPGITTEENPMLEPVFIQALKENAASILVVQNKNDVRAPFAPEVADCVLFHQVREMAKTYDVPLKDYILLGDFDKNKYRYNCLSFVDHFSMK